MAARTRKSSQEQPARRGVRKTAPRARTAAGIRTAEKSRTPEKHRTAAKARTGSRVRTGAADAKSEPVGPQVTALLAALERAGTRHDRDNLARFGIVAPKAFGVSMKKLDVIAKPYRRRHKLALALWETGWYEARMLATLVDEPARVTKAQMESWCRDFDNWAVCDTACFKLFDRTPHAWDKAAQWCERRPEFEKRAAYALIASLALHDKKAPDEPFLASLSWIERCAGDERNFVKKGVSWALRGIGKRNPKLRDAALEVAWRLDASTNAGARWAGKDAARELEKKR